MRRNSWSDGFGSSRRWIGRCIALGFAVFLHMVVPTVMADHPRLFVDNTALAKLRNRATAEPFKTIVRNVEAEIGKDKTDNVMYNDDAANHAILYLATGDRSHASAAEKLAIIAVNDKPYWNRSGSKGLTRAAGVLRVAIAYDLCYDAWSEETRRLISGKLKTAADGLMKSMGEGANNYLPNNWQAVRYGGAGLAYLSCDEPGSIELAKKAYGQLVRHLNANLGDNGWNPEGIGYTQYPWQFTGPFAIAAFRAGLGDLRKEVPKAENTLWTTYAGTVAIPRPDGMGLHADLSDDHPTWRGDGTAGLAFWYSPTAQQPAIKWMYDYLVGPNGDKSFDVSNHGGLYSLLLYPDQLKPINPAQVASASLNYTDASHGIAIFRNRYQDENDIVALVNAHSRQPRGCHGGPDTNTFRIMGLGSCWAVGSGRTADPGGQTNLFPGEPKLPERGRVMGLGSLKSAKFDPNGGGLAVVTGSCMGVEEQKRIFAADYSGSSGAAAVFVISDTSSNGKLWRWNTPEFNLITPNSDGFTLTGPTGSTLTVTIKKSVNPTFRTGTFERGGGAEHAGFPYHDKKYINNNWIEFDCDGSAMLIATLQPKGVAAPPVKWDEKTIQIGKQLADVSADSITFNKK